MDIIFSFDKLFIPNDTKEQVAKSMYKDGMKSKLVLVPLGLMTYYNLKNVKKYDLRGEWKKAERSAEAAYNWYDGIIKGVPEEYVLNVAKKHAAEFSQEGKGVLEELSAEGHTLYLVSGDIQECAEIILKENGVNELFEGIYCNPLVVGANGRIERLEKRTSTPAKKVKILEEAGIDLTEAIPIGTGYWERELFLRGQTPIYFDIDPKNVDSAKKMANENGYIVTQWSEIPDVIKWPF